MFEEAMASARKSAENAKSAVDEARRLRSLNTFAMVAAAIGLAALALIAMDFLLSLSGRSEEIAGKLSTETVSVRGAID
jgi:hypothetical protein